MHVGIFVEERRRGTSEATALREALELAEAAEAGGLDGVWLGEIHFTPGRSVQSAPFALASFMAARTRRIRIGTAVTVVPLAHPLRIAEEVATVDQLSEGRFDLGIGRSGSVGTYDVLGIPYAESQARFEEALAIMRQAWTGEPFAHDGTFYRFGRTTVAPRPCQQPHPPLRMAANSPETFVSVGRAGLPLFVGLRDLSLAEVRTHLAAYRTAWRQAGHAGHGDVCLRIPVYAAREEPRENTTYFFRRHFEITRARASRADTGPAARTEACVEALGTLTYDDLLRTRLAYGTAARLTERLRQVRDELGLDGIIAELNPGGLLSMEQMRRTLGILTQQVVPALR